MKKVKRMGDTRAHIYDCFTCGKKMESLIKYDLSDKTVKPRCPRCTVRSANLHIRRPS